MRCLKIISVDDFPSMRGLHHHYELYGDSVGRKDGDYDMSRDSGKAMRKLWKAAKKFNPKVINFCGCRFPEWLSIPEYVFYFSTGKKLDWYVAVRVTLYS